MYGFFETGQVIDGTSAPPGPASSSASDSGNCPVPARCISNAPHRSCIRIAQGSTLVMGATGAAFALPAPGALPAAGCVAASGPLPAAQPATSTTITTA